MESNTPLVFPFPFAQPYAIQQAFMKVLYRVIDGHGVGLFESPTGTGKSLSILCGALKWLRDNEDALDEPCTKVSLPKIRGTELPVPPTAPEASGTDSPTTEVDISLRRDRESFNALYSCAGDGCVPVVATVDDDTIEAEGVEEDWWTAQWEVHQEKQRQHQHNLRKQKRDRQRERLQKLAEYQTHHPPFPKKRRGMVIGEKFARGTSGATGDETLDADFCVDEYCSEDEDAGALALGLEADRLLISKSEAIRTLYASKDAEKEDEEVASLRIRKIYYCSRTHSQLSQFVNEAKRTEYAQSGMLRVTSLGSRKNLCVNPAVARLASGELINNTCLDLMKDKNKDSSRGCPYYDPNSQKLMRDHILLAVQDMEDIVKLGTRLHACPYYASRSAVPAAELVVLPYNMLLHKKTRESLGIDLRNNIVIIDEAHNVIDAINDMYSVVLDVAQVSRAHSQLLQYKERYKARLKAENMRYVRQLLFVMQRILRLFSALAGERSRAGGDLPLEQDTLMRINSFLFQAGVDNINLFKLDKYIVRSDIVRKLNGFAETYHEEVGLPLPTDEESCDRHTPALGRVHEFLLALTNTDDDGRIRVKCIVDTPVGSLQTGVSSCFESPVGSVVSRQSFVQFLLLNPAKHFQQVAFEARSVVLAGGTMRPLPAFVSQLLSVPESAVEAGLAPSAGFAPARKGVEELTFSWEKDIHVFSCGHVVPAENLFTCVLSSGPRGISFDLTYKNRSEQPVLVEIGLVLSNIMQVVPGGVVCFFPSYAYEEVVYAHLKRTGALKGIERRKKVFREARSGKKKLENVLSQFSEAVRTEGGACLFSIVGGKMSEGINFSDELGRCIVMVGMPYPNPSDPVLVEKLQYVEIIAAAGGDNSSASTRGWERSVRSTTASWAFLENLCMKSVNQSIGRAIRHANDYAALMLVDTRYTRPSVQSKLPEWIRSTVFHPTPTPKRPHPKPFGDFGAVYGALVSFFSAHYVS